MPQRLTTRDRNHRRPPAAPDDQCAAASRRSALGRRNRILIAVSTRQVASPHRHNMRISGARSTSAPTRSNQVHAACASLPSSGVQAWTSAARSGSYRSRKEHIIFKYSEPARNISLLTAYLPTTRIENVSGTICPRAGRPPGGGAGAGVNSAVISSSQVRLAIQRQRLRTRQCLQCLFDNKLVGLFSFTIVPASHHHPAN